jgi:sec-independent protein translocase protein TatA
LGSFSLGHWLVVLCVILIVFGAGKLPRVMGDFAKGIKTFKANLQDDQVEEDRERLPTESRRSS